MLMSKGVNAAESKLLLSNIFIFYSLCAFEEISVVFFLSIPFFH